MSTYIINIHRISYDSLFMGHCNNDDRWWWRWWWRRLSHSMLWAGAHNMRCFHTSGFNRNFASFILSSRPRSSDFIYVKWSLCTNFLWLSFAECCMVSSFAFHISLSPEWAPMTIQFYSLCPHIPRSLTLLMFLTAPLSWSGIFQLSCFYIYSWNADHSLIIGLQN